MNSDRYLVYALRMVCLLLFRFLQYVDILFSVCRSLQHVEMLPSCVSFTTVCRNTFFCVSSVCFNGGGEREINGRGKMPSGNKASALG